MLHFRRFSRKVSHAHRLANILFILSSLSSTPWPSFYSPPSHSPGIVSPYNSSPLTKERTRPATLNPITIDQWPLRGGGGKCAYLNSRAQIRLDAESPVRSDMVSAHSWFWKQSSHRSEKKTVGDFIVIIICTQVFFFFKSQSQWMSFSP